eukprot:XP_001698901.1 mitochondrial type-II NADH dehydrogenase [Chlamydomonas reinhardtii]
MAASALLATVASSYIRRSSGVGTSLLGAFSNDHRPCGTAVYQHLRRLAAQAQASKKTASSDQLPLKTGRQRLVVLGSGWAAARLLHDIDPNLYDLTVISPRNHMVFTPLLASTTVGTLEPRSVAVHLHEIQPCLSRPSSSVFIADAHAVDAASRTVTCRSVDGLDFSVQYDKLAICTGSQGSTFGIPGVLENAHFLRDVKQADAIRQKLIENIALAGVPGRQQDEFSRLLHIVIVGGGPTGVEVAGELTDFISHEVCVDVRVTLVEARELLGSFDASLREYAARKLIQGGVLLRKGIVHEVTPREVVLKDGTVLPYGLCIWSTGVGPTPFSLSLPFAKTAVGRIAVDKYMRSDTPSTAGLAPVPHVYALGDVCANPDKPLPALAQVAEQQGRYLARVLNELARGPPHVGGRQGRGGGVPQHTEFVYRQLGAMATVGGHSAVLELGDAGRRHLSLAGFLSWVAWRSAYLTRLGSIPKRLAVAFDWSITMIFGRDLSRW